MKMASERQVRVCVNEKTGGMNEAYGLICVYQWQWTGRNGKSLRGGSTEQTDESSRRSVAAQT